MSGYLLSSQGDRMAMGNSVEGRYPFLDYRVIEYCSKLPDRFKLNSLNEKFILKKLSLGKVPESISNRPKQPYRAPISNIFNNITTPEYIHEILSDHSLNSSGIFDSKKVKILQSNLNQKKTGTEIDQMAIVGILSSQILFKKFIKDSIIPDTGGLKNYKLIDHSNS
jgi:asparagine synthase (glutamine-hydrolysing)